MHHAHSTTQQYRGKHGQFDELTKVKLINTAVMNILNRKQLHQPTACNVLAHLSNLRLLRPALLLLGAHDH